MPKSFLQLIVIEVYKLVLKINESKGVYRPHKTHFELRSAIIF